MNDKGLPNVIAIGDSYNDIGMPREADHWVLFNANDAAAQEFRDIPGVATVR